MLDKEDLPPDVKRIVCENGTEPPFANAFWDNHEEGVYVDVVSGQPLFCSVHKFDSGSGWPSFFESINPEQIVTRSDNSHGMIRVEVRSRDGDIHLGHIFNDGPPPTGLRYCINSAALKFIPVERLDSLGYGDFLKFFA